MAVPDLLCRVHTDHSNGKNSNSDFEPANGGTETIGNRAYDDGEILRAALLGRDLPQCPYLFFTSSLLFALVFAAFRQGRGESDIHITCIDTLTARTPAGLCVQFQPVDQLTRELHVDLRNRRDDSQREFTTEYVATSNVCLGEGSSTVALEALIRNGLYELYPELSEINKNSRNGPKVQVPLSMLRAHGFERCHQLSESEINVAARLASAFTPSVDFQSKEDINGQLLAWILSFRKRDGHDNALRTWLGANCTVGGSEVSPILIAGKTQIDSPECDQYEEVRKVFATQQITANAVSFSTARVEPLVVARAKVTWSTWAVKHRQERWEARANTPHQSRAMRRYDRLRGRDRDERRDHGRADRRGLGREDRVQESRVSKRTSRHYERRAARR